MIRKFCLSLALMCAVSVPAVFATLASANAGSNAIIEMTIGKIGFLVGVSRGDGKLFYNGRQAELDINGLRVGLTIGASFANMRGEVYNLTRIEDIAGTYVSAQASAVAISGGGQNLVLINEHNVRLVLWGEQRGLDASLDAGGMLITLR
ncbi:hypothetical protein [Anderseniella sp. Alg231-50]|uniref:hypothetical protein n=1 Tax=Anderseniella sp. Alg231-50 TaxID=1922226 RepID=UPI000D560351